jgi:hypothetical protein
MIITKIIRNPLNDLLQPIQTVLRALASQEGNDGEPYDQMIGAADYIDFLEQGIVTLQNIMKEEEKE